MDDSADNPYGVAAGDLDGDGDPDLAATIGSDVSWYENADGAGEFWVEHLVTDIFTGGERIVAQDMDGDGALDLVAAGFGKILWWENALGDGQSWAEHVVDDEFFVSGRYIDVMDIDADGDVDILGVDDSDEKVAWWENDGTALAWARHHVADFDIALSAVAADVDGDGRLDIVAGGDVDDAMFWFRNFGGNASFVVEDVSPTALGEGEQVALLSLAVTHDGRAGDAEVQLLGLDLLLEEFTGNPLETDVANDLLTSLDLYLDDGSGTFDPADLFVGGVSILSLTEGVQSLVLAPGGPELQVSAGETGTYFVTATLSEGAGELPLDGFQVTHLHDGIAVADAVDGISLDVRSGDDVSTGWMEIERSVPLLTVSGTCPGEVTIAVEGATPRGDVLVIFSQQLGSFELPFGVCAGTLFDLDSPSLLFSLVADADGRAEITGDAPASACGAFLQAHDVAQCRPTNVYAVPVPE